MGSTMAKQRIRRRLAAILSLDMVGYTRLMAADEEGTLSKLKQIRSEIIDPKIKEFHGRIVKEMGDGLLIEFSSTVDAVECAAEIQTRVADQESDCAEDAKSQFRAGINLGDIMVEGEDIFGDGVNIATRLEGLAEPGGICISAAVLDQIRNKLDLNYDDLGQRLLKNIAEPVQVYRILLDCQHEASDLSSEEQEYRQRIRARFGPDMGYFGFVRLKS